MTKYILRYTDNIEWLFHTALFGFSTLYHNVLFQVSRIGKSPIHEEEPDKKAKPFEVPSKGTSIPRFYTDSGPRDSWDAPLNKYIRVNGIKNRRQSKTTLTTLASITTAQSLIAEKESREFLSQVSEHLLNE